MRSIPIPFRDYESPVQNIDEIHGIIDEVGFEAAISYIAVVARAKYSEDGLATRLFDLAESKLVKDATKRLLRFHMVNVERRIHVPMHARNVRPKPITRAQPPRRQRAK